MPAKTTVAKNAEATEAALILRDGFIFGKHGGETIKWRMLNKKSYISDGYYLLLSEYIIDCAQYDNTITDLDWDRDWSNCSLRKWLNNDFYNNAFSASEKSRILDTVVSGNGRQSANDLPETTDKVYLLNTAEVKKYLSSNKARIAEGTAYAKGRGLWCNCEPHPHYNPYSREEERGKSWWWLRNRGSYGVEFAAFVIYWGSVCGRGGEIDDGKLNGGVVGDNGHSGVRPVIRVQL
jgi:hypothetical protein